MDGRTPRRHMTVRRKLAYATLSTIMVMGLLEGVARISAAPQVGRFQQINEIVVFLGTRESDLMLDFDRDRFWKLKPNISIEDANNTFWRGVVSNSLGFRGPEFQLPKPEDTLRIVCFGDSSTFGIGARMEDSWPRQLEALLEQVELSDCGRRIEVINAGVPGYTSFQGLQHMRQETDRLQPDIVLASYANNDFWHWDNQTDADHAATLNERGTIHELLAHSRLFQLVEVGVGQLRHRTDQPDADQDWASRATQSYFDPVRDWTRRVPLEDFRKNINAMADLCEAQRAPLVLVKWPDQIQAGGAWSPRIDYQDVLDDVAIERQLELADVVSAFQRNRSWSVGTYVPNDIVHVNRRGNWLAAMAARDAITNLVGN